MTEIIVTFSIFWLLAFTLILPFGLKIPETWEKGHASSAPINSYFKYKFLISIMVAIILTIIYIKLINHFPNLKNIVDS